MAKQNRLSKSSKIFSNQSKVPGKLLWNIIHVHPLTKTFKVHMSGCAQGKSWLWYLYQLQQMIWLLTIFSCNHLLLHLHKHFARHDIFWIPHIWQCIVWQHDLWPYQMWIFCWVHVKVQLMIGQLNSASFASVICHVKLVLE